MAFHDSTPLQVGSGADLGDRLLQIAGTPPSSSPRSHLAQPPRYVAPQDLQEVVWRLEAELGRLEMRVVALEQGWPVRLAAWLRRMFGRS